MRQDEIRGEHFEEFWHWRYRTPVPLRIQSALNHLGLLTVDDIVRRSEADFLKVRQFGRGSLRTLKGALALAGLTLGMPPLVEPPPRPPLPSPPLVGLVRRVPLTRALVMREVRAALDKAFPGEEVNQILPALEAAVLPDEWELRTQSMVGGPRSAWIELTLVAGPLAFHPHKIDLDIYAERAGCPGSRRLIGTFKGTEGRDL